MKGKQFLRQLLTATLANILGGIIILILVFVLIVGRISSATEKEMKKVSDNSVLTINVSGSLMERGYMDPFAALAGDDNRPIALDQLRWAIKEAKEDDRIKGIYLNMDLAGGGYASYEAFRKLLEDFKESGKFIIAHGEIYTEKTLYLASAADEILLYPTGNVEWNGMASNQVFLRGLLDELGMDPILFRVGKYKSAAENIVNRELSEPNRKQIKMLLNDMWSQTLETYAQARGLSVEELDTLAAKFAVVTAKDAKEHGLVDDFAYFDEVEEKLRDKLGLEEEDELRTIGYADYYDNVMGDREFKENKIAVIYAVGNIIYGEGNETTIGSETLSKQIREAREDENVKAVVLRINSGGGSALASDIIWREIMLTKKEKPVIASMGDVAASGGYYIAAPADKILAEPNTVTGSIGVIGLLLNSQDFFEDELYLNFQQVYSHNTEYADLGNPNRPMSDYEKEKIQRGVDDVYEDFLEVVKQGRNFPSVDSVHTIAQGRVWSGIRAKEIGLVDELGGLDRALELAAEAAGLEEYRIQEIPKMKDPFQRLLEDLGGGQAKTRLEMLAEILPEEHLFIVQLLQHWNDPRNVYMRTTFNPATIQ